MNGHQEKTLYFLYWIKETLAFSPNDNAEKMIIGIWSFLGKKLWKAGILQGTKVFKVLY